MSEYVIWILMILMILTVFLMNWRINVLDKEVKNLTWHRATLIDKLRELGVLVRLDKRELTGLRFRYTLAADELRTEHYYPSSWDLEQQINYEHIEYLKKKMEEEYFGTEESGGYTDEAEDAISEDAWDDDDRNWITGHSEEEIAARVADEDYITDQKKGVDKDNIIN